MMKTKNFIKPQYNNSINTQHCGRLPEKTNFHHAVHLTKKNTNALTHTHIHTEKEITYEHKTTKKERKDSKSHSTKSHNMTVILVYQIQ